MASRVGRSDDQMKADILKHMNNDHQDSLALYLEHYNGLTSFSARNARLTSISLSSLGLSTSSKSDSFRVPFDPPLKGWSEVRERVVSMDKECRKALNREDVTVKEYIPARGFHAVVGIACLATFILLYRKDQLVPGDGPFLFNRLAKRFPSVFEIFYKSQWIFWPMVAIHLGEAILMDQSRLKKYGVPRGSPLWFKWIVSTSIEGFGNFQRFDALVARLRSAKDAKKH